MINPNVAGYERSTVPGREMAPVDMALNRLNSSLDQLQTCLLELGKRLEKVSYLSPETERTGSPVASGCLLFEVISEQALRAERFAIQVDSMVAALQI